MSRFRVANKRRIRAALAVVLGMLLASAAFAMDEVYQSREAFVEESFPNGAPATRTIWVAGDLKQQVRELLGRDLGRLRVRYWTRGGRTAWILEEVGKIEEITSGVVIQDGRIERLKVLIYRESRGWEVRFPFFTDQFRDATLEPDLHLDRSVDGISGATLSVHAITTVARLALLLDRDADHDYGPVQSSTP
jgi:hypothetical protein